MNLNNVNHNTFTEIPVPDLSMFQSRNDNKRKIIEATSGIFNDLDEGVEQSPKWQKMFLDLDDYEKLPTPIDNSPLSSFPDFLPQRKASPNFRLKRKLEKVGSEAGLKNKVNVIDVLNNLMGFGWSGEPLVFNREIFGMALNCLKAAVTLDLPLLSKVLLTTNRAGKYLLADVEIFNLAIPLFKDILEADPRLFVDLMSTSFHKKFHFSLDLILPSIIPCFEQLIRKSPEMAIKLFSLKDNEDEVLLADNGIFKGIEPALQKCVDDNPELAFELLSTLSKSGQASILRLESFESFIEFLEMVFEKNPKFVQRILIGFDLQAELRLAKDLTARDRQLLLTMEKFRKNSSEKLHFYNSPTGKIYCPSNLDSSESSHEAEILIFKDQTIKYDGNTDN